MAYLSLGKHVIKDKITFHLEEVQRLDGTSVMDIVALTSRIDVLKNLEEVCMETRVKWRRNHIVLRFAWLPKA